MLERFVTLSPVAFAYRALAVRLFDFAVGSMRGPDQASPFTVRGPQVESDRRTTHQSTSERGMTTLTRSPGTFAGASTSQRMRTLPRA